jgi:Fur family transcriptional regulator, peroxide stress response regulator
MKKPAKTTPSATPYRHSKQRERILELLRSTEAHPTANWVYARLRKEFPNLSMGTVYRNIGILTEQGLIKRIDFGSTFDRLDAKVKAHYHFICEQCGAIIDLDIPVEQRFNRSIAAGDGFVVRRHDVEFYGLCPQCSARA